MKQLILSLKYKGVNRGCIVQLPSNFDANKEYHAVLDLHGYGQRSQISSNPTEAQVINEASFKMTSGLGSGFPQMIKKGYECEFIIISPQMWGNGDWEMEWVDFVYDYLKSNYKIGGVMGVGISKGGGGINNYAAYRPDALICTIDLSGIKAGNAYKRKSVPDWSFFGDQDWLVRPSVGASYVNELNKAGGEAYYTYFQGMQHDPPNWNAILDGTMAKPQMDYPNLSGRKEYSGKNPVFDWFYSLIEGKPLPEPIPEPVPNPEKPIPMKYIKPLYAKGSHDNPKMMWDDTLTKPLHPWKVGWNFKTAWWNEGDLGEALEIVKLHLYDGAGSEPIKIFFSEDGIKYSNPITVILNGYEVWKVININTKARYIKFTGETHVLPAKVVIESQGEQPAKTYNLTVNGATEEEFTLIKEVVGDKVKEV